MPSTHDPSGNLCPQCGKKPGKPKFCSQSCAAKHNNRRSPKRQPEGKCKDCGAAIPTRLKRCKDCTLKHAEAERKAAENIQSFRTPAGEVREFSVPKVWINQAMVFDPNPRVDRRFTMADLCGDFLDVLLGVVFARPAYIRPDDIHRYAAWIDAFRSHVIDHSSGWFSGSRISVAKIQLRALDYALRNWVDSFIRADNPPLFPTLALDAARFIEAHAYGKSEYFRDPWRIVGLARTELTGHKVARDLLDDPRLKHEITGRLKGTLTRCIVPLGGSIPGPLDTPPLLSVGDAFVFEVERCHLTNRSPSWEPGVRASEGECLRYDIAEDFWFHGRIYLDPVDVRSAPSPPSGLDALSWQKRQSVWAELPVRWITDVYEWSKEDRVSRPVPIQKWTA